MENLMDTESNGPTKLTVSVDKLVRVYMKMRARRVELKEAYDREDGAVATQMGAIKKALLDYCKDHAVDSVRTAEGMFYRTVQTRYWTNDWESMGKFIVDHNIPELLEKRLHQGNVKQFIEEHPELLPPGLNVDSEYTVTVRRK
jgi:hypothetical protein